MKKNWADYTEKILYVLISAEFLVMFLYSVHFIVSQNAPLIPHDTVSVISDWTYTDQLTGPEAVTAPVKVETGDRDTFIFDSRLPDSIPDGAVIAFLNRVDFTVEVGGRIIKEWSTDEAPIAGGPAKNSYFIIPVEETDAGSDIRITFKGDDYNGKMFDVFVGEKYETVRYLELKSGPIQFALSFALLVCSFVIIIAGLVQKFVYKQDMKLVFMAAGIFIASTWMTVDSYVFQFIFRTQYIDGLMSYMSTLCIVFPFLAYLNAIQEDRYKRWYVILAIAELASLVIFTCLHFSRILSYSRALLPIDAIIAVIIIIGFAITIYDVKQGNAGKYKYVAYGFIAFMIMAVIEIILINTVVERVEGGVIIVGLYILFTFAILQQVSEIRQVQLERDRANEEGAAKTKFLASMSHEIRTPINSIMGMNEMILKESRDPDILNYAGIISDSGTILLSLINDVLDFSKIGSDMEEIVAVDYDPVKMFSNLAEILKGQAGKKGLEAKIGMPRNLPRRLHGDDKRITQVIINLLSNAVKYTEEGTVTFSGECFESDGKYILCFYVSDTGIGIRQEDISSVFEAFQRVDLTRNQNIQGTGLGLSIVKSLVDKMNGEINVESVYGKGSTFSVRIPQEAAGDGKYNSGNAIEDENLDDIDDNYIAPEARILEVDDNASNQIVVREFLKETKAVLDIASDGREAFRLCRLNKYDVILMDHMMPDPDGIETMHMIRSDESGLNKDTPQIILTANAIMGSRSRYEEEGFDNYLSKPVESVRLIKMVRKYLPESKVMYRPKRRSADHSIQSVEAYIPPAAKITPEGPVDFDALLARFDGKEETVNMILEEVVKEGDRKIPLLKELVESEDVKRYAVEAHGVKGVMSSSCIPALSATAKSHELAAKEGNFAYVKDNIDSFLKEYSDVIEYIREYLKGRGI
ncbi:MAG: response regulator [Lachnospiraceae bacterium]|nr:response regulator [Lachnospiraceae bacterium]